MTVAVALFRNEISPRFDCCAGLVFVEPGASWIEARHATPETEGAESRIQLILQGKTDVFLCGGIRRCDYLRLQSEGVTVIPGLTGPAAERYREYLENRLQPLPVSFGAGRGKGPGVGGPPGRGRCRRKGEKICQDSTRPGRRAKGR